MISIVIPAYNAAATIGAQLEALARELPGSTCAVEIVVADNGSDDSTVAVVSSWAAQVPLRAVDASARRGAAAARNIGARESCGDFLVFVDADDVVLPGWLHAWELASREIEFGGGPLAAFIDSGFESFGDLARPTSLPVHMGYLPFAGGGNAGFERGLFERTGGFNESYRAGEDVELSWRVQVTGTPLQCVPDAVIAQRVSVRAADNFRQCFRYGRADPYLYKEYAGRGVTRPPAVDTLRSYLGLGARLPLAFMTAPRRKLARQAGRRAGRIVGSFGAGAVFL